MTVHILYGGVGTDIDFEQLAQYDVGDLSGDPEILTAVEQYVGAPVGKLRDFEVVRHEGGNMTVKPQSSFGW